MSYTTNCIVCAENLKRREAHTWIGYVLLLDKQERKKVVAGFCKRHVHKIKTIPHHPQISRSKWCYGIWTSDMGIDRISGPLV